MPSYRELLQQVKSEIEEMDAPGARDLLDSIDPPLLVDVREQDEWNEGHLPGAVHVPRGNLESRIERAAPDRSRPVVLYCQSGNRSAFAAKTLEELGYENVVSLAGGFTDWKRNGFPTRYLVNDASVFHDIPVVHGSIYRFEGQVTVFKPHEGPCYRCLFPQPPPAELAPSCAEGGVLGVLPGIIGSLQANEALKLALDIGESLSGRLLLFDALSTEFSEVTLRRDPECPVCGEHPTITDYIDYVQFCAGAREPA